MTLKRTEYDSQRSEQPENVNFEPIIRGLKIQAESGNMSSLNLKSHILNAMQYQKVSGELRHCSVEQFDFPNTFEFDQSEGCQRFNYKV